MKGARFYLVYKFNLPNQVLAKSVYLVARAAQKWDGRLAQSLALTRALRARRARRPEVAEKTPLVPLQPRAQRA